MFYKFINSTWYVADIVLTIPHTILLFVYVVGPACLAHIQGKQKALANRKPPKSMNISDVELRVLANIIQNAYKQNHKQRSVILRVIPTIILLLLCL